MTKVIIAGALVLMLGAGFIIVSLVGLGLHLQNRLLLRRLRAAAVLTCGELLSSGRFPGLVLVTGQTAAGPAGLLRSPAFDQRCVWFHTDVVPITEGSVPHDASRSNSHPVLDRNSGPGPIGLADSTGAVLLDLKLVLQSRPNPAIIRRRGEDAQLSVAHRALAGSGIARLEQAGLLPGRAYGTVLRRDLDLREEVVEPGRPVTVLAQPRRAGGGLVILGRAGAISTDHPAAWIENLQASLGSDRILLRLFPVGLVIVAVAVGLIAIGIP